MLMATSANGIVSFSSSYLPLRLRNGDDTIFLTLLCFGMPDDGLTILENLPTEAVNSDDHDEYTIGFHLS